MINSPSRSSLGTFRMAIPKPGHNDHAAPSIMSPHRQASRPLIAEEGVRHFEDAPLPLWSLPPRRSVSPTSRGYKGSLELNRTTILEPGVLQNTGAAGSDLSFSAAFTPTDNGALVQLPPAVFEAPHTWEREYVQLRSKFLRPNDSVAIYHDYMSPLNSRLTMRYACIVRPLPNLEKVQETLRQRFTSQKSSSAYDAFEQQCSAYTDFSASSAMMDDTISVAQQEDGATLRGPHRNQLNDTFLPQAQMWCVCGSTYDNEIAVYSSATGQRLMRVVGPKVKVAVTALHHAPFRGFMEAQQLRVLPVREPQDVLRLKHAQLVYTDYVWCGLQDGTLRLIPASHHYIRAGGPSPLYSKSASADLVYELPRYQGGAIVSIVRSPGHDEAEEREAGQAGGFTGDENPLHAPATHFPNRVSEAVHYMAAAAATNCDSGSGSMDTSRRHFSLVCTASTDATVVIWDVRKVYEAVAQAQQHRRETAKTELHSHSNSSMPRQCPLGTTQTNHNATATASTAAPTLCSEVITFDCSSPIPGLQNMVVRSSCTLIQVRPLAKLSGGFAGLTSLLWVSSLITTGVVGNMRDVRGDTRIPQIAPCPPGLASPSRDLLQTQTRSDKRRAQRDELELTEEEMQGMERELEVMMPPLATEPPQSLRVNLLIASDCLGTVHVWNLDEELHRYGDGSAAAASALGWPADFGLLSRPSLRSMSSCSESRSSVSYILEPSAGPSPTRQSTKRRAAGSGGAGGLSQDSGGSHKRTQRSLRSRRPVGGLGLAEARENRGHLSDLAVNTASATDVEDSQAHKSHRPSLSRCSGEKRETNSTLHGHWPHGAAGQGDSQRRSIGDVSPSLTPPSKSHLLRSRNDTNASTALKPSKAASIAPPGKKTKNPRSALQDKASTISRASQQRTPSLARKSLQRTPAHPGESHHHAIQPTSMSRSRASVQRGPSVLLGNRSVIGSRDVAMPAQASKCQLRLSEGVAITEMVVDLPKQICTTLRRIRNPSRAAASWRHRPSEEEMDARVLENEFEELTEEKALFFAFQRLELYVGVEGGAVSTVRCAPEWMLPDHDGRELFKLNGYSPNDKQEGAAASAAMSEWMKEVKTAEVIKMDAFQLHLHQRLLDVHVQPVTELFLDAWQGRLWVSRQDGFVSIFSTQDKQLLARIAHPSADAPLPPPSAQEWMKLQAQCIARCVKESHNRTAADVGIMGFGLECHKECKGLPPSHLTEVLPIGMRRQRALIVLTSAVAIEVDVAAGVDVSTCKRRLSLTDGSHPVDVSFPLEVPSSPAAMNSTSGNASSRSSAPTVTTTLVCLDGRSDMKSEFRARECRQWSWLQQLQQCRLDSFAACQAQRRRYYALCGCIGGNVGHVIKELGDYAALSHLRAYFHAWKDHRAVFRHTHVMRRQRTVRMQREQPLAHQLGSTYAMQLRGTYFVRWMQLVAERRRTKQDAALYCFTHAAVPFSSGVPDRLRRHRRPLPTAAMMERLRFLFSTPAHFARWQAWAAEAAEQRRARGHTPSVCLAYTPLLSLKRSASSPLSSPSQRRVCAGQHHVGVAMSGCGAGAEDVVTPTRLIHNSTGAEMYAYTPSWSNRGREKEEEAMKPLYMRLESAPVCLPVSVEPFMAEMAEMLRARVHIFHFSDARSSATSVLDESWTVILENAESGADGDSDDERRFSVFRFALLPLLQGLLSTADDVLPNLFDNSVAEEVLSMLVGIVLAMDYVTANVECMPWLTSAASVANCGSNSFDAACAAAGESTQLLSMFDASLMALRIYAVRAFRTDPEAAAVLRGLAKSRSVLAQFLDFAMERAVARRVGQF